MRRSVWLLMSMAVVLLGCATPRLAAIPPGATVDLPVDHGPHDDAQTEWWHVHADLRDVATGEEVHVFAGFVVERTELDRVAGLKIAPLVDPYHVAYVQVVTERGASTVGRANFPLGHARFDGEALDLRQGPWRVAFEDGVAILRAGTGLQRIELRMEATRPATLPGGGEAVEIVPGTRHHWYQQEGMKASGSWRDRGRLRTVEGTAFFKHQWGRLYHPDVQGFEWFSFDLPGGRTVVLVKVHSAGLRDGPGSLGFVSEGGTPRELDARAVRVDRVDRWRSPRSGASWPVRWRLQQADGTDLEVAALHRDQELTVFPAAFYAGPARVVGTFAGEPVDTIGFVEHVGGWAPPLRFLYRSDPPPEEASR